MVVDEHDAGLHAPLLGRVSSTSVPEPGDETIDAVPPARAIRPSIDSASPRRSSGTAARSKPAPRSRTKTPTCVVVGLCVDRDLVGARELCRVRIASRAASTTARTSSSSGQSPPLASSIRTPWSSSISAAASRERADERVARSRRRCRRASRAARAPAAARATATRLGSVGVALDQRQRLQHGVVDARGHLGALLDPDPLGALGVAPGERQSHGPTTSSSAADDGARREAATASRRARARAARRPRTIRIPASESGAARAAASRRAATSGRDRPPTSAMPAIVRPDSPRRRARASATSSGSERDPVLPGMKSQSADVQRDPGAAGEREHREDEPDERRVDVRASPRCRAQTPAMMRSSSLRRRRGNDSGSSYGAVCTSTLPAPTWASIDQHGAPSPTGRSWS